MSEFAKPCFKCGKELKNVDASCENQPYDGMYFTSPGNYGSAVFDSLDGHRLEIAICDDCMVAAGEQGRVLMGREFRLVRTFLDGQTVPVIVGREKLDRPYVDWRKGLSDYGDDDHVTVEPEEVGTRLSDRIEWHPAGVEFVKQELERARKARTENSVEVNAVD